MTRAPQMASVIHSVEVQSLEAAAKEDAIRAYYRTLLTTWGPQHWWPARTRFEVIVGAYLTQNTAWKNVQLALGRLRGSNLLNLKGVRSTPLARLEALIRTAGYFRQKALRLKTFVAFLDERYGGSLHRLFAQPPENLRPELLALDGVGPETADSILLYAGQHPVFVVDAYTRRILDRHGVLPASAPYEQVRELCERALAPIAHKDEKTHPDAGNPRPASAAFAHRPSPVSLAKRSALAQVYNEMHGLIVMAGKNYCLKSQPRCDQCPLRPYLPDGKFAGAVQQVL